MHLHPDLVTSIAMRHYQDLLLEGDETRRARLLLHAATPRPRRSRILLALARINKVSRVRPTLGLIEGTVR